jgi:Immunoglobulin I-set domain
MVGLAWLALATTACFPQTIKLIEYTNTWRYDASGNDLGTTWTGTNYDDSGWLSGAGAFGFPANENLLGAAPVQTPLLRYKPDGITEVITYYFRTRFELSEDLHLRGTLTLSNLLDDGAVFYVNGVEVGRIAMPAGNISYAILAARSDEISVHGVDVLTLPATNLMSGTNVLAVELHQGLSTSSDAIFALNLTAKILAPIVITSQPGDQTVTIGSPASFSVGVSGSDPLYRWHKNGIPVAGATSATLTISNSQPFNAGDYFVVVMNTFGSVTSRVAMLTVLPDTTPPALVSATEDFTGSNWIFVTFSERLLTSTATNSPNFTIAEVGSTNMLEVLLAQVNVSVVRLTVAPWIPGRAYVLTVNNVRDGSANTNLIAPNSQIAITFYLYANLLPLAATWKWDESGSDLGTAWRQRDYDDSEWPEGQAIFSFDFNDFDLCGGIRRTAISYGPTTYYFRTHFNAPPNGGSGILALRHVVDDAAAFYLNGLEIRRYNLPAGSIGYGTSALVDLEASCVGPISIPVTNLLSGDNLLAVEVHQSAVISSDLDVVFGAELTALLERPFPQRIAITKTTANSVSLSWEGSGPTLQSADTPNGPWSDVTTVSPHSIPATEATKFFRLRTE